MKWLRIGKAPIFSEQMVCRPVGLRFPRMVFGEGQALIGKKTAKAGPPTRAAPTFVVTGMGLHSPAASGARSADVVALAGTDSLAGLEEPPGGEAQQDQDDQHFHHAFLSFSIVVVLVYGGASRTIVSPNSFIALGAQGLVAVSGARDKRMGELLRIELIAEVRQECEGYHG